MPFSPRGINGALCEPLVLVVTPGSHPGGDVAAASEMEEHHADLPTSDSDHDCGWFDGYEPFELP